MYPGLVSCPFYAIPIYPFKFTSLCQEDASKRKGNHAQKLVRRHRRERVDRVSSTLSWWCLNRFELTEVDMD